MEKEIIEIISGILGVEPEEVEPDLDLFETGLVDSFGMIQVVVELEERFGISLPIEGIARADIATPALIAKRVRDIQ